MSTAGPDVRARIDSVWDQLSPAERRVAAMVRHDPELLLVGTSAELAAESGTSKATVSRLVRSLGFQDAAEVRQNLMSARGSGLPDLGGVLEPQRPDESRDGGLRGARLGREFGGGADEQEFGVVADHGGDASFGGRELFPDGVDPGADVGAGCAHARATRSTATASASRPRAMSGVDTNSSGW
jgi:hypothetical protein